MVVERDVPVLLRDGVRISVDVHRPTNETAAAPLIAWSPYGKHGHVRYEQFPGCGVEAGDVSEHTAFEGPDPAFWVPRGYAVINADPRGLWHSEGRATYVSPEEARDQYDLIEWAGSQPWSNGKVGLTGVSYLAVSQWNVAALRPPHLAAINPWEGWTDIYREVVRHGGIPETKFWPFIVRTWGFSASQVEDLLGLARAHPLFDEYWESKRPDLSGITVPAFVVASWADQGLHLRGTLEGFKRISSEHKWLDIHGRKKWAYYYDPENTKRLQEFFDHFLQGEDTPVLRWPKVRFEVRDSYLEGRFRSAERWPLDVTTYEALHLDASTASLQRHPVEEPSSVAYSSLGSGAGAHRAEFDITFEERVELVGHMSAKLWMSADEADDLDVFVAVVKLDANGDIVPFAYYSQFDDGPVALGWLRASHRELEQAATDFQPIQAHRQTRKLSPGEIVALNVEIWPSGTRFEAGDTLRLIVQGTDVYKYGRGWRVQTRHEDSVNVGRNVLHTGGKYDSRLVVPVVPAAAGNRKDLYNYR